MIQIKFNQSAQILPIQKGYDRRRGKETVALAEFSAALPAIGRWYAQGIGPVKTGTWGQVWRRILMSLRSQVRYLTALCDIRRQPGRSA